MSDPPDPPPSDTSDDDDYVYSDAANAALSRPSMVLTAPPRGVFIGDGVYEVTSSTDRLLTRGTRYAVSSSADGSIEIRDRDGLVGTGSIDPRAGQWTRTRVFITFQLHDPAIVVDVVADGSTLNWSDGDIWTRVHAVRRAPTPDHSDDVSSGSGSGSDADSEPPSEDSSAEAEREANFNIGVIIDDTNDSDAPAGAADEDDDYAPTDGDSDDYNETGSTDSRSSCSDCVSEDELSDDDIAEHYHARANRLGAVNLQRGMLDLQRREATYDAAEAAHENAAVEEQFAEDDQTEETEEGPQPKDSDDEDTEQLLRTTPPRERRNQRRRSRYNQIPHQQRARSPKRARGTPTTALATCPYCSETYGQKALFLHLSFCKKNPEAL